MKIVKQSASLIWITPNALQMIERAGRVAYKSEDKITPESAPKFIRMLLDRGHESVIEHACASMHFVTDRGISHEFVRHRLFSFTQESTRYCNYTGDKFGNEITVICPPGLSPRGYMRWETSVRHADDAYDTISQDGATPQIARAVLPTCLKTEIVVTGNFREWRHFFRMRTAKAAHPQMRELAVMALAILKEQVPVVFDEFNHQ